MENQAEEQRGKRQTSRAVEFLTVGLIVAALGGLPNAFEILELLLPYIVAAIVGLRGLDAHYNPKRI